MNMHLHGGETLYGKCMHNVYRGTHSLLDAYEAQSHIR